MPCNSWTWIWDIIVYNEYAVVICVFLIFGVWSSGLWYGEILWKYLYLLHSRQVTGCSKILVPNCQTVWCHDPDNYDLSFHAVKTWDLMMFIDSLRAAEKLLKFFVNCRMTPVMTAYPYFGSCKCHCFFTEVFYCGWSVIYWVFSVLYVTHFHFIKVLHNYQKYMISLCWQTLDKQFTLFYMRRYLLPF